MVKGEFERIAVIRERLGRVAGEASPDVRLGVGDDAAVLAPSDRSQVLTVDAAVENVHFRTDWASWHDIGRRAFVAAASDLAAMGAEPRAALLSLVLRRDLEDDELFALVDGVAEAAAELRIAVVGGNLASGTEVSIHTTAIGQVGERMLTRRGARPGDGIYVTGDVGSVALGAACLGAGADEGAPVVHRFCDRWRRPNARVTEGRRLLDLATAAIDVSDGVLQDLGHICESSEVGARIDAGELPLAPGFRALAEELGEDPLALALGGGEDYQLLFTAPASVAAKEVATRIGQVTEASEGIVVVDARGETVSLERLGFDHFG